MHTSFIAIPQELKPSRRDRALKTLSWHAHNHVPDKDNFESLPDLGYKKYELFTSANRLDYLRYYFNVDGLVDRIEFVTSIPEDDSAVIINVTRNDWAQDIVAKILQQTKIDTHGHIGEQLKSNGKPITMPLDENNSPIKLQTNSEVWQKGDCTIIIGKPLKK